jgi:hypothetical protein
MATGLFYAALFTRTLPRTIELLALDISSIGTRLLMSWQTSLPNGRLNAHPSAILGYAARLQRTIRASAPPAA